MRAESPMLPLHVRAFIAHAQACGLRVGVVRVVADSYWNTLEDLPTLTGTREQFEATGYCHRTRWCQRAGKFWTPDGIHGRLERCGTEYCLTIVRWWDDLSHLGRRRAIQRARADAAFQAWLRNVGTEA